MKKTKVLNPKLKLKKLREIELKKIKKVKLSALLKRLFNNTNESFQLENALKLEKICQNLEKSYLFLNYLSLDFKIFQKIIVDLFCKI